MELYKRLLLLKNKYVEKMTSRMLDDVDHLEKRQNYSNARLSYLCKIPRVYDESNNTTNSYLVMGYVKPCFICYNLKTNETIEISIRSKQFHEYFSLETVIRFNETDPFNNANHNLYKL